MMHDIIMMSTSNHNAIFMVQVWLKCIPTKTTISLEKNNVFKFL